MKTHSGTFTRTGMRLSLALAVLIATAGLMLAGGATGAKAVGGTGRYSFSAANYQVVRGQSVLVTVNRSGGGSTTSNVCWAVGGSGAQDINQSSGVFTFLNAATSVQFSFTANTNRTGSYAASLTLSLPCNTDVGTIDSPNPVTLTVVDVGSPTVTGIAPHSGPAGTLVTITGTNFTGVTCPGAGVKFNGTSVTAACTGVTATTMTVQAPAGGTTGDIIVTNGAGSSAATAADIFTYTTGPTVTSVVPASGPAGSSVTINGTGLSGTICSNITFGGTPVATCGAVTATSIAGVIVPTGTGTVDVRVTNGTISPNTPDDDFTYTGGATITGVSPASGPTSGGQTVTITGTNLTSASSVTFGGVPGTSISVAFGGGSLTVVTPSTFSGTVNVTVTTPAGSPTAFNAYTFTSAPTVSQLSPNTCPASGGNTISVTGTGFVVSGTTVSFGLLSGTSVNVTSANSLTVVCPAQTGTVSVRVSTVAGMSPDTVNDDFTYGAAGLPNITSLSPASGPITGGNTITITGANFSGATQVTFGSAIAVPSSIATAGTSLTVVVPASSTSAAQTVEVVVTTPAGPSSTVGTANDYIYTNGPTVTAVSPATGPASGLTFVTITGTGFTPTGMTVTFGGTTAVFTYLSATSISAVSPAHVAGIVDVIVTVAFVPSPNTYADDFTYTGTSAPVVTSLSPTSGPVGTSVTVSGTGFTGATSVTVGGVAAAFTVVSDSSITLTIPTGTPSGLVSIRITTPGGQNTDVSANNFTNTSSSGATTTYTLYFRWSLIAWTGIDNISASNAVKGIETGTANPATNDVSGSVTAIWYFDGPSQVFKGYFVGFDNTPGANDFTTLRRGTSYWIAISTSGSVTWTVLQGP